MKKNIATAHCLSIDWEDFGQLACRDQYGIVRQPLATAIERQTNIILEILNDTNQKATFFILGILAKYRPDLVRCIQYQGHEIAIHGYHHRYMTEISPAEARADLSDAVALVQDITGEKVYGYRAPYFSINTQNFYILELLAELGLEYDSSIFPMQLPRYGIADFNPENCLYQLPNGSEIVELPLSIFEFMGKKIPVSGGGYWRLMPKAIIKKIYAQLGKNNGGMIYFHPYEFDTAWLNVSDNYPPEVPKQPLKTILLNLKWNLFQNSIRKKVKDVLSEHTFVTCLTKARYVKSHSHSTTILGRS